MIAPANGIAVLTRSHFAAARGVLVEGWARMPDGRYAVWTQFMDSTPFAHVFAYADTAAEAEEALRNKDLSPQGGQP